MTFKAGEPRPESAGRKKGSVNKTTVAAKQAFQLAFDQVGGVEKLVEWANKNQTDFYKLYGRLIPQDVNANMSGAVKVDGTIKFVRPNNKL